MTSEKLHSKGIRPISTGFVFPLLITLLTTLIGWAGFTEIKREIKENLAHQLESTLTQNIEFLKIWIGNGKTIVEAFSEMEEIRENIISLTTKTAKKFYSAESLRDTPELSRLRAILGPACEKYRYSGFVVFDITGRQVAALLDDPVGKNELIQRSDFVQRALQGGTILSLPFPSETPIPDLKGGWKLGWPTLFVATPVRNYTGKIIGVLAFRHRPEDDFTRILETGRFGQSGETYAFNREGIMISGSRFDDQLQRMGLIPNHPDSRSSLSLPVKQPPRDSSATSIAREDWPRTKMAETAIKGEAGMDVDGYLDYRGIQVVGAWTWLPKWNMGIATEIDAREALAPLVSIHRIFLLLFILLIGTLTAALTLKVRQSKVQLQRLQAEKRTRSVVDNAQDAIITICADEKIESFNPAAEKMFGYRAEEVIGQNVKMLMPEPYRSEHSGYMKSYMTTGKAKILGLRREVIAMRKDGSLFDMELSVSRMDLAHEVLFIGIVRDITEQKAIQANQHLHAAQQEAVAQLGESALSGTALPALMNQATETIARVLNVEFTQVLQLAQENDEAFYMLAGIGWSGLNGKPLRIPRDQVGQAAYTLRMGQPVILTDLRTETRFENTGLPWEHDVVSGISALIKGHDQPFGVLAAHSRNNRVFSKEDIHFLQSMANILAVAIENLESEERLRSSESSFYTLARISPVGIFHTNLDGVCSYVNECWEDIFDLSLSDFDSKIWTKGIHPEDRDRVNREWECFTKQGIPFRSEFRVRPGGEFTHWVLGQVENERDSEGTLTGYVGSITDITDRKRVEAKLQTYAAELERSNEELEDFAFIASHDLQEPLRKIMLFGDRIRSCYANGQNDPRGEDYIDRLQKSIVKMQSFIDDLLEFSRITRKSNRLQSIHLEEAIQEALSVLELKIAQTQGEVVIQSLPSIYADRFQMEQLFQNLLSNALKFQKKGQSPKIVISSRKMDDGDWEISFKDNGIGFKQKYIDRIFRPFERLHTPAQFEGSGMGLAICQKIVQHHGGRITACSEPGEGATFTILLPGAPHIQTASVPEEVDPLHV